MAQAADVTTDWILIGDAAKGSSNHGVERRKRIKVFTKKERCLFTAFEKADQRAKEDAMFHLERYKAEP